MMSKKERRERERFIGYFDAQAIMNGETSPEDVYAGWENDSANK